MATVANQGKSAVDDFVAKLKSRMDSLGLKPRELAEKAHVGFPYLYRVLNGKQEPSMKWAAKVGKHVSLEIKVVDTSAGRRKPRGSSK